MKKYNTFDEAMEDIPPHVETQFEWQSILAESIGILILRNDLKKSSLCEIGFSEEQVEDMLSGEHNFTLSQIALLSDFFQCDLIKMVEYDNR